MSREAMKQPEALRLADALDAEFVQGRINNSTGRESAVELRRLYEALETEQKPVAWTSSLDFDDDDQEIIPAKDKGKLGTSNCDIPLYATPKHDYVIDCPRCGHCCAEREWVGLTDDELLDFSYRSQKIDVSNTVWFDRWGFARAIEAKLKEKNT